MFQYGMGEYLVGHFVSDDWLKFMMSCNPGRSVEEVCTRSFSTLGRQLLKSAPKEFSTITQNSGEVPLIVLECHGISKDGKLYFCDEDNAENVEGFLQGCSETSGIILNMCNPEDCILNSQIPVIYPRGKVSYQNYGIPRFTGFEGKFASLETSLEIFDLFWKAGRDQETIERMTRKYAKARESLVTNYWVDRK